jgi:uncharacterized protein (TIGR02646 family)
MQYIDKSDSEPREWNAWFTTGTGRRSYDYAADQGGLLDLPLAKAHLWHEQNGLCAYCQSKLPIENASIEHVIPKTHNVPMSTNYHNLVVVCKKTVVDPDTLRRYCEPVRGDRLIPSLVFYRNAMVAEVNHAFFDAYADGTVGAMGNLPPEIKFQVASFIEILNLNHEHLKTKRAKDALSPILEAFKTINPARKRDFLRSEFNRVERDPTSPFRQFLLIYLGKKIGLN